MIGREIDYISSACIVRGHASWRMSIVYFSPIKKFCYM